jgi:hypothetical protein
MNGYVICSLSEKFYREYPLSDFPEIMEKKARPYLVLIATIDGVVYAIPFRTHAHPQTSYLFKSYFRDFDDQVGLDYSKTVVLSDPAFKGNPARLNPIQKEELDSHRLEILEDFKKYLDSFKKAMLSNNPSLKRRYQYSSLQYFIRELGIGKTSDDFVELDRKTNNEK